MRRKYNALFHILATLKYETYVVLHDERTSQA